VEPATVAGGEDYSAHRWPAMSEVITLCYRPGRISLVGVGRVRIGAATFGMKRLGGTSHMWKTIGWLSLMCGVFIGMLISLSIIGFKG